MLRQHVGALRDYSFNAYTTRASVHILHLLVADRTETLEERLARSLIHALPLSRRTFARREAKRQKTREGEMTVATAQRPMKRATGF